MMVAIAVVNLLDDGGGSLFRYWMLVTAGAVDLPDDDVGSW